ncbi:MAG: aminotransferase class IV [Patescibacteria group bacterium]|nr:aminotransferase class IV [Patescibacteria group bacterium]
MKKYCYINEKIVEEKNACISPHDLGILRGYGVFDFMCTTKDNKPFLLHDHWMRLKRSAAALGMNVPISKEKYEKIISKLIAKNSYKDPAIRTVLTAGISENGITLPEKPTFYILIHDITKLLPSKQLYKNGGKLITHDFFRDNHASKTTNYIEAIKNQKEKSRRGAIEILYTNKNKVLECTTSNIFIVKNEKLITPADGILPGITRKLIIKLAKKNNLKIQEKTISKKQLFNSDEIFITGSAKHILPIIKVDSQKINDEKPGTITQQISKLYFDYLNNY